MSVLGLQDLQITKNQSAGETCQHLRAEWAVRMIHPGSIFAESGPDWEEVLYCPDCGQPIHNAVEEDPQGVDLETEIPF